jgi:hypothetical protein
MNYLDESYITETLTEEELYKNTFEKSNSFDSLHNLKSLLNAFEYFTQDKFQIGKKQVLEDLASFQRLLQNIMTRIE